MRCLLWSNKRTRTRCVDAAALGDDLVCEAVASGDAVPIEVKF